jgi:hypothetical protein
MAQVERTIELALEEARRGLTYQAGSVDELRSRSGILLAAAAITGSFLGSAASNEGDIGVLGIAAIVAFIAAVVSCLYILWPREWTFVTSPKTLLEDWADTEREQDIRRFVAEALEDHYDDNKKQTDRLMKWFQFAAISVGLAVILGCLALTTSI